MKIIGQVFEEENYDAFHRLNDNRDVLSARLSKLITSISERWILNPIIVNEKMEIIDGQGRFEALKRLNKPIPYIISPGATSEDCRRMNKYNTRWSVLDFANSWSKAGKIAYTILLDTCQKTKLSISHVMRLSNHGTKGHGGEGLSFFELGKLEFNDNDQIMVINIKNRADEITEALQSKYRPNDAFYTSVKIAMETNGYDHSHMLKNCTAQRSTYCQMANINNQLVEFERIYNYKTAPKKRLYFSDYMRNKGFNIRDYAPEYSPYNDNDVSTLKNIR